MVPNQHAVTPGTHLVPPGAHATDGLFTRAGRYPDEPLFARKVDSAWCPVTARAVTDQVTALAAGLVAAGINTGDRVAVMAGTSYAWVLCGYAIWAAGAVTVPVYETSAPAQVAWILRDSEAVAAFVEDDDLRSIVAAADGPFVRNVRTMDDSSLHAVSATGADIERELQARRRQVTADSTATIVYTSGTTGRPKGCAVSHRNLVAEINAVMAAGGITDSVLTEDTSVLLFLPLAHILARVVQLALVRSGAVTAHSSDVANVAAELRAFRPTLFLAVPRVFEKFRATAERTATASGHANLFGTAEATAVAYSGALDEGGPSPWLRIKHRLLDRLVYAKLRDALGGRVTHAVSGSAPLSPRLAHFLRGIGITVLEGYGLTETTAAVTLDLPDAQRIGSVGRPPPGWAVRIAADGEILASGTALCHGYWHNDQATEEAFDGHWLHTGDLGRIDDGYLTVTGRKKDLIVTAYGKNVAPAAIEDRLGAHWLIDHCVLVGDGRPYIGALLTLDPTAFTEWKAEHHKDPIATVADLSSDHDLLATIQAAIDEVNHDVSPAEAIRRFRIIADQFTVNEELTPTQKVRRDHVLTKFDDDVRMLYGGGTGPLPATLRRRPLLHLYAVLAGRWPAPARPSASARRCAHD